MARFVAKHELAAFQKQHAVISTRLLTGRTLRGISHLITRPGDIWLLPLVAVMTIIVALPVKTYAFLTMNTHGWLTRRSDLIGGEAQSAASLR